LTGTLRVRGDRCGRWRASVRDELKATGYVNSHDREFNPNLIKSMVGGAQVRLRTRAN
jgi:hypothetical protein